MKKHIVIGLALMISSFSFSQKKEIKTAEKAIKSSNFADAKLALQGAEALMSSMDEKTKAKFYFLKGKAFYANATGTNNDIKAALESLDKVSGSSSYASEIAELKQSIFNSILKKGNEAYNKKDYVTASTNFESAYRVSSKDTIYLYYAASTAVSVQDFDRALMLYSELKDLGFTGIEKQYFAINKESGEEEPFQTSIRRDLSVKAGTHIDPAERITDSKKAEIVKNIALIYVSNKENEKAIAAMKEARDENPDDIDLLLSEANVHYKMGNIEEFTKLLLKATEKDPTNPELQYNLGVITAETGDIESAKVYYSKSIELDPTYVNAQINMASLILNGEESIIEEMNGLGNSAADNKRYDELKEMRHQVYIKAIPYLEDALKADDKNLSAARTLMSIYSATENDDKYQALKAKIEGIESGN